jgi:hypothetical protein
MGRRGFHTSQIAFYEIARKSFEYIGSMLIRQKTIDVCLFVVSLSHMNSTLLPEIMKKAAEASARLDVAELERLTALARRVQENQAQRERLDAEKNSIEAAFRAGALPPALSETTVSLSDGKARDTLRITVDWKAAGLVRERVVIQEPKASETLVAFARELYVALGEAALEKLTKLRVSRGPFVSQNPRKDFVNRRNGTPYMYHPVSGTSFYVLTHSATVEKLDAVRRAGRLLGLSEQVITAECV